MARALVSVAMGHLLDMLHGAAFGRFPPPDGTVTVVQEPVGAAAAVLGFTAHFVVCAPVDPAWVHAQLPSGDLSAPLGARFVVALPVRGRGRDRRLLRQAVTALEDSGVYAGSAVEWHPLVGVALASVAVHKH
jgi:hypothetical protein